MIPEFLKTQLCDEYGDAAELILQGYKKRKVTLRANTLKISSTALAEQLSTLGIKFSRVAYAKEAFVLHDVTERDIQSTELYQRGEIYLQSLSSMLPPLYLNPQAGESVLDMTAAPGGKTTYMSALSGGKALITACEKDRIRFNRMKYNIDRQGAPRVTLMNVDALKLDDFFRFDKILLDAPCSGSGTLTGEKCVISPKLISNSVALQKNLLKKAIRLLKRGGEIIYSTCSILKEENEQVIDSVLTSDVQILPLTAYNLLPLINEDRGMLTIYPNERYEGFFVAKLKKA